MLDICHLLAHAGGWHRCCGVVLVLAASGALAETPHQADTMQDERVMQLFGLVNTMLANDRTTADRDLSIARSALLPACTIIIITMHLPTAPASGVIRSTQLYLIHHACSQAAQYLGLAPISLSGGLPSCQIGGLICRYAVIPLSPNSGLIGWVPNTDTLHALIREYREARKIPLNVEHRLMMGMAPDHDHLTVLQKVEVFEHALESTNGEDLHKVPTTGAPAPQSHFVCKVYVDFM